MTGLEYTQFFTNIATPLVTVGGIFFVWQQIKEFKKDMKYRFDYQKREKAIEIAKEFEILLEKSTLILTVLESTEINKIIKNLNLDTGRNKLIDFSYQELVKIVPEYKTSEGEYQFSTILEKTDLKILSLIMQDYNDKEYHQDKLQYLYKNNFKNFTKEEIEEEKNQKKRSEKARYNTDLVFFKKKIYTEITTIFITTLNKLEHMSMNFICKIADDDVVYNSLHQVFLKYIELCYIFIAQRNIDAKDKYYVNIIQLYNLWKNRYLKELEEENELVSKLGKKNSDFSDIGKD